MEAKSSTQMVRFFTRCLSIAFTMFVHVSELEFFHQIVANLPQNAIEIVRFIKTFKIYLFLKYIYGFFGKKLEIFQKPLRLQIYCRMRVKWIDSLKMSFPL